MPRFSAIIHVIARIDAQRADPSAEELREIFSRDEQRRDEMFEESMRLHALRFLEDEARSSVGERTRQDTFEQLVTIVHGAAITNRDARETSFREMQDAQQREYLRGKQARDESFGKKMSVWEDVVRRQVAAQDAGSAAFLAAQIILLDKMHQVRADASAHMKVQLEGVFDSVVRPCVEKSDEVFAADMQNWHRRLQEMMPGSCDTDNSRPLPQPRNTEPEAEPDVSYVPVENPRPTRTETMESRPTTPRIPNGPQRSPETPVTKYILPDTPHNPTSESPPRSVPDDPATPDTATPSGSNDEESPRPRSASSVANTTFISLISANQNAGAHAPSPGAGARAKTISTLDSLEQTFQQNQQQRQARFLEAEFTRDARWKQAEERRSREPDARASAFGQMIDRITRERDEQRTFHEASFRARQAARRTEDGTRQAMFDASLKGWERHAEALEARRDAEYATAHDMGKDLVALARQVVDNVVTAYEGWVAAQRQRQQDAFDRLLGRCTIIEEYLARAGYSHGMRSAVAERRIVEWEESEGLGPPEPTAGVGVSNILAPVYLAQPLPVPETGDTKLPKNDALKRWQRLFEKGQAVREAEFVKSTRRRQQQFNLAELERQNRFVDDHRRWRDAWRALQTSHEVTCARDLRTWQRRFSHSEKQQASGFEAAEASRDTKVFSFLDHQQSSYAETQKTRRETLCGDVRKNEGEYREWERGMIVFVVDWGTKVQQRLDQDRRERMQEFEEHVAELQSSGRD